MWKQPCVSWKIHISQEGVKTDLQRCHSERSEGSRLAGGETEMLHSVQHDKDH